MTILTAGSVNFPHIFLSLAALCVVVGIGYLVGEYTYGIGYRDGKQEGRKLGRIEQELDMRETHYKPPF